ncbi:hypothetical protein C0995_013557 [Termitomyces sp. Mi166|nr:hypothetical protein C0995_013557 [Termitomyces sp. Mi166\
MSLDVFSVPLALSSSSPMRTYLLLSGTVAASVARIPTLPDHRLSFDKVLESLQRQGQQDAHKHITSSIICNLGETRLLIRTWYKDEIRVLSKAGVTEKIKRLIQVAKALEHLHEHNIIHGHLHPGNIFITVGGDATVADASLHMLARAFTSLEYRVPLEPCSVYQAPEALDSHQTVLQPSSDVYAFASVVYAVMTGRSPLDTSSIHSIRNSIQEISRFGHSRILKPSVAIIKDDLWQLLERCWSYNPEARPKMKDVIFDLEDILLYM